MRRFDELVPPPVHLEQERRRRAVAGEADPEAVLQEPLVEAERKPGQPGARREGVLLRLVEGLEREHARERVAVAGREAAGGEERPLQEKRRDRAEDAAGRRLVAVRVLEARPVEQHGRLADVAAADVQPGPLVHGRHAGQRLEGAEHVGRRPRRRHHVEGPEGDALGVAARKGAGLYDGLAQLDERLGEPEHNAGGVAGREHEARRRRLVAEERGARRLPPRPR